MSRLLDYVLLHPLTGICPVGSTGEGPLLSRRLRTEVTASVARHVPDGVWNIPAAVATTLKDVVDDLVAYADAGADAALVTRIQINRINN